MANRSGDSLARALGRPRRRSDHHTSTMADTVGPVTIINQVDKEPAPMVVHTLLTRCYKLEQAGVESSLS